MAARDDSKETIMYIQCLELNASQQKLVTLFFLHLRFI